MENRELEVVQEEKHIGVLIRNDLKASNQCSKACNKANRVLGILSRPVVNKSSDVMLKLYKSLVHPYVEYYTPV